MTVAELGRRMSAAEMAEWEVYASLEPFGFEMHNLLAARICQAAVLPYSKHTPKLEDWMFDFCRAEPTPKTNEEIMGFFKAMAKRANRKGKK